MRHRDDPEVMSTLFDERRRSEFQTAFTQISQTADRIDLAFRRLRLSTLGDLASSTQHITHLRLLVGALDAHAIIEELAERRLRPTDLETLLLGLEDGTIAIRTAPLTTWSPDFSVFRNADRPFAVLLGTPKVGSTAPFRGPCFISRFGATAASLAFSGFGTLWDEAHDVTDALYQRIHRYVLTAFAGGARPKWVRRRIRSKLAHFKTPPS